MSEMQVAGGYLACAQCETPLRKTVVDHNVSHNHCSMCREFFCIEHGMDRRHPDHPKHCVPGEW